MEEQNIIKIYKTDDDSHGDQMVSLAYICHLIITQGKLPCLKHFLVYSIVYIQFTYTYLHIYTSVAEYMLQEGILNNIKAVLN